MEVTETKAISLEVLNERENSLIALAASAKDLTITGPDDKMGYKLVREKRIELKAERVQVQNDAFDLRENAVKFQKTVIKREKQLVAIISEEETRLSNLEDTYDQWQDEIKKKKDKEENDRIQTRVDALSKFGYAIDFYEAKIMEDENFLALLDEAEAAFIKEQERIANEKVEAERLKKEEDERMQREREELARAKAEQEEIWRKRNEEIARDKAERDRIKAEQEVKEAEIQAERRKFEEEKRKHEESVRLENARKEAAEKARLDEQNRIKREEEEKAERQRKETERLVRDEALKPDKEKFLILSKSLYEIQHPYLTDAASKELMKVIRKKLDELSLFVKTESEKL